MHYYDDPGFSYPDFWADREYEHEAEILAIQRLMGETRVDTAVDIGGGFGRLVECLSRYARRIIVIEPSEVQRRLVERFAPRAIITNGNATETSLPVKSCDLVVMIRVAHHLPNLQESLDEMYKILKPGGLLILEFANANNFKSELRHYLRLRRVPLTPINVSKQYIDIPFVNHHPKTIKKMLHQNGFVIQKVLSVSNFRSPLLKKILPLSTLLSLEGALQQLLGRVYFGPSIFILARRPVTLRDARLK
jgi:ubiquinone/menaquinone biosynthesis C-methylase UbiE